MSSRISLAVVLVPLSLVAQERGQLTGKLLAQGSGRPILGARIVGVKQEPAYSTSGPTVIRAITDSIGSYRFENVPTGFYRLCVYEAGDYLDPCQWSRPAEAAVSAGTVSLDIRLEQGVWVSVRVEDPQNLVAQHEARSVGRFVPPAGFVTVSVAEASGRARPVPLTHRAERLLDYSALVPADAPLRLVVASDVFLLADAAGTPIDARGHSVALRLPVPAAAPPTDRPRFPPPIGSPVGSGARATIIPIRIRGFGNPGQ